MKRHLYAPGFGPVTVEIEADTATWTQSAPGACSPALCRRSAALVAHWIPVAEIDWPGILSAMREPPPSLSARSLRDARELLKSDFPTDAAQGWTIARHLFSLREPAQALMRRLWAHGPDDLRTEAGGLMVAPLATAYEKGKARADRAKVAKARARARRRAA